jgi:hypothetical protein
MTDLDDETIKGLMYRAFERAFEQQIMLIYKTYLANVTTVPEQKAYAKKGIENAIAGYRLAISSVDSWES